MAVTTNPPLFMVRLVPARSVSHRRQPLHDEGDWLNHSALLRAGRVHFRAFLDSAERAGL